MQKGTLTIYNGEWKKMVPKYWTYCKQFTKPNQKGQIGIGPLACWMKSLPIRGISKRALISNEREERKSWDLLNQTQLISYGCPSREIESVPWSSASTDPDGECIFHNNPHQILTKRFGVQQVRIGTTHL
jgi:hypothetical protein